MNKFLALRIHRIYISLMIATLQTCKGKSSQVKGEPDKHYLYWDLENCKQEQAEDTLSKVQFSYTLSDIYLVSDKEKSFRGYCFSKRTLEEYIEILQHTKYVDFAFISWTLRRRKAIIRTSSKLNRPQQQVVSKLEGYEPSTIPNKFIQEIYETGYTKLPHSIRNYKR